MLGKLITQNMTNIAIQTQKNPAASAPLIIYCTILLADIYLLDTYALYLFCSFLIIALNTRIFL